MSDKEYLARRAIAGMMPHLNRVFEELVIHHEEHKVPTEVLKSLEDKVRKATAKNTVMAVETKKRKGFGHTKTVSKGQKIGASTGATSTSSDEEVAESVHDGSTSVAMRTKAKQSATCRHENMVAMLAGHAASQNDQEICKAST